jgi:hypothetical protein
MMKKGNEMFTVEKVLAPYGFRVVDTHTGNVVQTFKRKYLANAEAFFLNQTTMKTVTVLGTNNQIQIPVGTPHCCDPSTETYWSM